MAEERNPVPTELQARLKYNCRNRCAICAIMNHDFTEKQGQIAHIDHNHSNSYDYNNLVWLCLVHHDKYDSKTSQSKNYTPNEVLLYKKKLEEFYLNPQNNELIKLLSTIVQFGNDSDGYIFHTILIGLISDFEQKSIYPEQYNLLKYKNQLLEIRTVLQNLLAIFNPQHYHPSAGNFKLVFNIGESPDSLLEHNKNEYIKLLTKLNIQYSDFLDLYGGNFL